MSYAAVKWAKAQNLTDGRGKCVLIALAQYADADGMCFPSVRVLAEDTGKSTRTVRKHLNFLRESGSILSRPVRRPNESQSSNEYLLLMGQSTLLPWLQSDKASGVGEVASGVGEATSPLESLGNLYGIKDSLSSDENSEKLKLLTKTFGRKYVCILGEVEGRRDKWLELPLAAIKKAIADVTGHERFITDLKLELDKLANVKAPQRARRTRRGQARPDAPDPPPRPSPTSDPRAAEYTPVPGEKSAEAVQAEQERVKLEDETQHPGGWTERGKRFLERAAERAKGGYLPNGPGPPNSPPTPATIEPGGSNHADALPPTPRRAGPSSLRPPRHRRGTPGATSGAGGGGPP